MSPHFVRFFTYGIHRIENKGKKVITRVLTTYSERRIMSPVSKKPKKMNPQSWRPSAEDVKLIAELADKFGVSGSDILRMGIRALAQQQQRAS